MSQKPQGIYKFGPFTLNTTSCAFACSGQEIKIEPKTFDVLVFFVLHSGELVNREQIRLAVWKDVNLVENNVDRKISDIRKILSQHDGSRKYIETVPTRGWRFTAEVTAIPHQPTRGDAPLVAELAGGSDWHNSGSPTMGRPQLTSGPFSFKPWTMRKSAARPWCFRRVDRVRVTAALPGAELRRRWAATLSASTLRNTSPNGIEAL